MLVASIVYADPVPVTSCPFLMENNTQYILNQDLVCDTFPFSFIDLSLGPINSSVNLNGHTVDVVFNNFIGDFGTVYDIEVYGGNVIDCGVDGGGCIQWGGSGGGKLYLHDMTVNTISNFITTSINELPGTQRIRNVVVNQESGFLVTGWFLDLDVVNVTANLIEPTPMGMLALSSARKSSADSVSIESSEIPSGMFLIDGGDYFMNVKRYGYDEGKSDFDLSNDGSGTSTITLLNSDINSETECDPSDANNGCDLVTWIVLDDPEPTPIVNVTTTGDLIVQFKHSDHESIKCDNCDGTAGSAVIQIATANTASAGCGYVTEVLSSLLALDTSIKAVRIDKTICSDNSLLSSMPVLSLLELVNPKNKEFALFK